MYNYYLATTGMSKIWDLEKELLLLGPWCREGGKNERLLEGRDYLFAPSPWKPAFKIKEAEDYCRNVYERLLPQLSERLNYIHQVSHPVKYWRVLIGPWLLYFIEVLYDRYKRIEKVLKLFPNLYTHCLPKEELGLVSFDTYDFVTEKVRDDYYNLKLFSIITYDLCSDNIIVGNCKLEYKIPAKRYSLRRRLFNKAIKVVDILFENPDSPIVLTDMLHLSCADIFLLKQKMGSKTLRFVNSRSTKSSPLGNGYSRQIRDKIKLNGTGDKFQSLLYGIIPGAIPICCVENYRLYRANTKGATNINSAKIVGSTTGWFFNEEFKLFAAETVLNRATLIDFQHGGEYGQSLSMPLETMSLEKDIFYTWGWGSKNNKIKPLPSAHLSKLKDSSSPKLDNILFVSMGMPKYHYRFHTALLPEDMPKYFKDKGVFFQVLPEELKKKVLYRPYSCQDYREEDLDIVKMTCSQAKFVSKGRLVSWMQKVKLVVVDHRHTSFIEALTINVPCVFYWDHDVYLMRPEAERDFQLLRDAEILFKDPLSAARKVTEVFDDPFGWWLGDSVQKPLLEFCKKYAYARSDWVEVWAKELKQLLMEHKDQNILNR